MTRSHLPHHPPAATIRLLAIVATFAFAIGGVTVSTHRRTATRAAPAPIAPAAYVPPPAVPGVPTLLWERRWPGVTFRESSPVAANLGRDAVVVGALDGKLYGLDGSTGADLDGWPVRTGTPINSSPAAADLFGTGQDSIVVGTGTADQGECSGGSVIVVDRSGTIRWQRAGTDRVCASQAFHSSPTIGDITGAGQPSITIGALGLRSWSWSAAGALNPGWPFYTDDTVFATAALADLHGNGVTDVVMGGDSSPGGAIDYRGGLVRAVQGDGRVLWQFKTNEIVRSSPAVAELHPGAGPSIVFGTGDYWVNQPGGATDAHKVFALDRAGHLRWSRDLGGQTIGGPALADVLGNGQRDVVIGTADGPQGGRVWVLDANGKPLPHWAGVPSGAGVVIGGITTADLTGQGGQDLLVPTGAGVFAFDGRTAAPLFSLDDHEVGFQSSPLVTREAGGRLAITVAGTTADGYGVVQRWLMPAGSGAQLGDRGWPTFHHDSRRTGNAAPPPLANRRCAGAGVNGYWEAGSDGGVFGWCGAGFHGSPVGTPLAAPVVGMASSASGQGYWEAAADGGVFAFGDAPFLGSAKGQPLRAPVVGMARTPSGQGYWLASADGGVFSFGDAPFLGGAGGVKLPFRVVSILATPSGLGYWLVGNEGTVLTYGDARFFGSPVPMGLTSIVGGAATPSGLGYWLVASDGGVFTYGDAPFLGSTGALRLTRPIVAMAATAAGRGYWLFGADGGVFSYGDAPFVGSAAGTRLNGAITAVSAPAG